MTTRRFINQFGEGESIDQIFLVADKQLRTNRNGNLYLQMRLSDRTGAITGMLWNANERVYGAFETGDFLRVLGATQFYNGGMQIIAREVHRASEADVDEADFVSLNSDAVDRMAARLAEMLREIEQPQLRHLAECFLVDERFMRQMSMAPAGIKLHHAYLGGLLEHVVQLMELSQAVAPFYPEVDADLLRMGAFLHDIGKIRELSYERELGYTDEGQLIGHLVIGVQILDQKVLEAEQMMNEPFQDSLRWRLQHMIVSHHGSHEFGSPKVPMTLEALVLEHLDALDAKLFAARQFISEDVNSDNDWTTFHPPTARKLYKPSLAKRLPSDVDQQPSHQD